MRKLFGSTLHIWTLDIWPDSVYAYGFKKRIRSEKILDLFVKSVYKHCNAIFISCKGFRRKIEKYVPDANVIFAPQWAPDDLDFDGALPHEALKKGFNFTFAVNIGKVQNLKNVIRGFALLSEDYHQARLNIIGDGSNLEHLKEMVEKEHIGNVRFWGRRPLKEMPRWFEGSDVLIISLIDKPIFSLTVPAKFQAYLASGKPIYCIMRGEVADLVTDHQIGFVSHPGDIEGIRAGFEKFLDAPKEELEKLGRNMRSLLDTAYDRNTIIARMTKGIFACSPFVYEPFDL
jgi:glycosyltransferase involved in cell wall biosynthesis